jgi:hypothetical protein
VKPRLLNLAAGVSLLLAIGILFLWVRSHGRHESISRSWNTPTEQYRLTIQWLYSSLSFTIMRFPDARGSVAATYLYLNYTASGFTGDAPVPLRWLALPPVRFQQIRSFSNGVTRVTIADWLLLLPTLPLPLFALARHRRRRQRETSNLCPTCGYDLRATPDRCPECGDAVTPEMSKAQ